jgi:uncharacterized protein (TIGR00725 family)
VGAGEDAGEGELRAAEECGRLLAEGGAVIVCGGRGGVMEAVCRGAKSAGGTTVGLLPGRDRAEANAHVDIAIPTGLGKARNLLVSRAGDAMIAIGGAYGTLSEIAFALDAGRTVLGLGTWAVDGVREAGSPEEAVTAALVAAKR